MHLLGGNATQRKVILLRVLVDGVPFIGGVKPLAVDGSKKIGGKPPKTGSFWR